MDAELVRWVLGTVLGSGGIGGIWVAFRAWRNKRAGLAPDNESEARASADWASLDRYFQNELRIIRKDRASELAQLRADRDAEVREVKDHVARLEHDLTALRTHFTNLAREDAELIDELEQHIWLRLPPPPPKKKKPGAPPPPHLGNQE